MKLLRNLFAAAVFVFVIWALLPGKASAEGEYTVHYETYGKLDQDVVLPDKSVSWDEADLGAKVSSSDFKTQYSFVNWYVDETFTTEYTKETKYSSLAGGDTSVTTVTLYAKIDYYNYQEDNLWYHPWAKQDSLPTDTGDYYLLYDVSIKQNTGTAAWTAPQGTTRILLDHHNISRAGTSEAKGSVIYVPVGASLTIEGNDGQGVITGGDYPSGNGGGIRVEGSLMIPWAHIEGNTAKNGAGIAVEGSGTATIRRVVVRDNTATENGGGIAVLNNAKVSLTGIIERNTAGVAGGGVYLDHQSFASLSIGIENGSWFADKSNWWPYVTVTGNTAAGNASDLYLIKDGLDSISDRRLQIKTVKHESANDSQVGIALDTYPGKSLEAMTIFTSGLGTKEYGYFFSDNDDYEIRTIGSGDSREACIGYKKHQVTYKVGDEVYQQDWVLSGDPADKPIDDPVREGATFQFWVKATDHQEYDFSTPVTSDLTLLAKYDKDHFHNNEFYKAWSSNNSLPRESGYYYLTNDVVLSSAWSPVVNNHVHICLNGHSITGGDSNGVLYLSTNYEYSGSYRNLDIYDCSEGEKGYIQGNANASQTVLAFLNCVFTLHGGTIRGNDSAQGNLVAVTNGATFNMKGGCLTGNKSSKVGAGVRLGYDAIFNMTGGSITDNSTTKSGGGVSVMYDAVLNMSGGSITGNSADVSGGGVYLPGRDHYNYVPKIKLKPAGKDIVIADNTVNGKANNVHLVMEEQGQSNIILEGEGSLTEDSRIGVTSDTIPAENSKVVVTSGFAGRGALDNFVSDQNECIVGKDDGEVVFTLNMAYKEYPITYNLAGGALPEGKTNPETYMPASDDITLNNPEKVGYDFVGWTGTDLDGATPEVVIPKGSSGARIYTATWKATEYPITYRLNGGELPEGQTNPDTYTVESEDITLVNPVREGFEFQGWEGTDIDDIEKNVTIPAGSMGKRKYTAIWEVVQLLDVRLEEHEMSLQENDIADLTLVILPENTLYKDVTWTSSDEEVVLVNQKGKILALKKGQATITVTSIYPDAEGHYLSDKCVVKVTHRHIPGDPAKMNEKAATCTSPATYDEVVICSTCGDEISRKTIVSGQALGHDWTDWVSCRVEGVDYLSRECSRYGCSEEQLIPVAKHDDSHTDIKTIPAIAPTCTSNGYKEYYQCNECGNYLIKKDDSEGYEVVNPNDIDEQMASLVVPATGHDWAEPTYDWDFTEKGIIVYAERVCSRDSSHKEAETVFVSAKQTKNPTCSTKGETTYSVKFANPAFSGQPQVLADVDTVPDAHVWNKGVVTKKATITATGVKTFTCTECGKKKTQTIAKLPKKANPLAVKAKTVTVKYKNLKKKAQNLAVTKVLSFTKKGQGKMSYQLVSAVKGKKSFKSYFKINASNGKVTIKKKLKKGTYKVKVKVKAAGNATYKASGVKTVTFKVKVK